MVPDHALNSAGVQTLSGLLAADREQEYPRTQEIAEAAYFHVRHGLKVPSARSEHANLVVFSDRSDPQAVEAIKDHGEVNWAAWRKTSQKT